MCESKRETMRRGRLERDRKNDDDEVDVDDNNIDLVDNRHKINNTVILHATSVSPTGPKYFNFF